ncbi:hypothetical protein PLESTF_001132700 [Pleodorina starrii]|nr:hypothetical protein PLESTF_001132700 [Pleodorina starrii]
MAATTSVNTGQLVQWLLEYGQRVRDIQERAWVYSHPTYKQTGLPTLVAMEGPYAQIISQNFTSIAQLLAELHRVLGSLTLRSYPDLLHQFMDTFCGAVKAGLLLDSVPRKVAAQMVQLSCAHVDRDAATQLRNAVNDPIFSASSMVSYMQDTFKATMPRIAQVLELVVGPAMIVADNCEAVASAGLLELAQQSSSAPIGDGSGAGGAADGAGSGEVETSPAMGMFGMTRQQVYPFLRYRETIRQWGILGFLIFPEILSQANASQRLTALLADGFALHLYKERLVSAHQLMLQHLGPIINTALGTNSGASNGGLSPRSSGGLGALLGKGMAMIGGVSRLRKSLTDEQDANEHKPPHPIFVDAAGAAAVAAPVQHRMWRAYVTGQLRNMHAAFSACPGRIPGQMDMLLAALSLGREEVLWFCRRDEDSVPSELSNILKDRGVLTPGYTCRPTAEDALQVEHHNSLCKQIKDSVGADLQAHVVTNTQRVEFRLRQAVAQATSGSPAAAAAAASGASGLQPFKDLTDLLRSVLLSSSPPADSAARVSSACGIWIYVSLQLASADPPLKAAKVLQYAENTRYLDVLQKSLDAARLLYEGPLLHASAADLAPGLQGRRVDTLRKAAKRAICSGRTDHIQAALGAMQAYTAATNAASGNNSNVSVLLSRNSIGTAAAAGTRNGEGAGASNPSGSRGVSGRAQGSPDDLPNSCMKDVLECLNALLDPVVQAPKMNFAVLCAARLGNSAHGRTGGPSLMRVVSRPKEKEGSGGGRSGTPERVRQDNEPTSVPEGPLSAKLHQLALEPKEHVEEPDCYAALREPGGELAVLPTAAELASRLVPLVFALDNGRMLLADSRCADALSMCRAQLLEAIRENFSKLIANTSESISKALVPVPSIQLGPLRLFIEVISMLQPHLATELLPELARLLLQQVAAPTLQTIGLETVTGPAARPAPAPPSTSAEAAAPTTPNADAANVMLAPRAGSMGSAVSVGPMTRSLNVAGNSARNSLESDRGLGPMTKALQSSSGGAAPIHPGGTVAPVSIVRALQDWLWRTIVGSKEERHPAVWYDAEVGAFVTGDGSNKGSSSSVDIASATSIRELSLIFELFGPCAASDLTQGCNQLIHESLQDIQTFLDANQMPLQDLLDSARMPLDKRLVTVRNALPNLTPSVGASASGRGAHCLKGLADSVQRLGRCLALRVQLGRAAAFAAERVADFVTLALREMATPVNVSSSGKSLSEADVAGAAPASTLERREWAALLRLSSGSSADTDCSYGACLLPERDDMLLTAHLASMLQGLPAAQRWHRFPALMAALMATPQWNAGFMPAVAQLASRSSKGSSTPRGTSSAPVQQFVPATAFAPLAAINTVTVAVCLSLQAAMSQVLHPAASQFLMGCGTPVAAMLCAYQRTALAVAQAAAADSSPAATAAKQQMLAGLEQIPMLRKYAYMVPYSPEEAAGEAAEGEGALPCDGQAAPIPSLSGSLELSQSWWASGNGVGLSISGTSQPLPKVAGAAVQIEVCEPSLADGRWSGEVDGWRPPSRLLPLVMGHVG